MGDRNRREVGTERETEPLAREVAHEQHGAATHEQHESTSEQFAGPNHPTAAAGLGQHGATASQLAYEEDDNERELKQKVGALVTNKFGGDYKKAFSAYDKDGDGAIGKNELVQLLSDAGVGSGLTRGIWATKIIEKLDSSADKKIEWSEFESVFRASA